MSQEEHAAIEVRDRPCSIEVESNFKGEIAIRTKWYFEPTLESAWEAFQNLALIRAALKTQYLGGTDTEVEQALILIRRLTGRSVVTADDKGQVDFTDILQSSIEQIKASNGNS